MISTLLILIIFVGFFYYDFIPTLRPYLQVKFKKQGVKTGTNINIEEKIIDASLDMMSNEIGEEFWNERSYNITKKIILFINRKSSRSLKEFRTFNYPKGFLLLGIILYLRKTNDNKRLLIFKHKFDEIFEELSINSVTRIDQSPFGTVALILYDIYKDENYLRFSEKILNFINNLIDHQTSLIKYRQNSNIYFNDTIGMAIPFLVEYSTITGNSSVLELCRKQMDYFNLHGINPITNIPVHGINWKKNHTPVGSANWGRGIGWYFYGLVTLNNRLHLYDNNVALLEESLLKLRSYNTLWSQFPGSSEKFDSSTTTMILASIALSKNAKVNFDDALIDLNNFVDENGYILNASGDTYGLNHYSNSFGKSDLSQGFLLILLSYLKH